MRNDIEAEKVLVQSLELTAAVLRLLDRSYWWYLGYIEPQDAEAPT